MFLKFLFSLDNFYVILFPYSYSHNVIGFEELQKEEGKKWFATFTLRSHITNLSSFLSISPITIIR